MSEGVEPRLVDAPLAKPAQPTESMPREERARLSGYRRRFGIVYVLLALATGVAVGALIVEALRDPAPSESLPTGTAQAGPSEPGELGAMQIADQVQRNYRLPNGDELVNVVASRNTLQDGNLGYLRVGYQVIRPGDGFKDKDSLLVQPEDAIQYSLCGAGQSCAIPGTASTDRGILVRRMGLELALRTLKFDPSVDNVTVFLGPIPPPAGVDGVVLIGAEHSGELFGLLADMQMPYVLTWALDPSGQHSCVGFDNRIAAMRVANYLADIGHREFAMIHGVIEGNDRARPVLGASGDVPAGFRQMVDEYYRSLSKKQN